MYNFYNLFVPFKELHINKTRICTDLRYTRKYPLRGYILGVLTHTTAWDRLWGGDVFLRMYVRSSASPRMTAVWQGFWNSDYVVLKSNIRSSASPHPAQQYDSEYFFVTPEVYLTTLFGKIFFFSDFFGGTGQDGTGQTGQTNRQTDIRTDRLFSGNIILDGNTM